jgi:hypothetical protein
MLSRLGLRKNIPSILQLLFHAAILGLGDGDLKTLGLAWTFRVGWRITNGTVGSCIHLFVFTEQPRTSSTVFAVVGVLVGR